MTGRGPDRDLIFLLALALSLWTVHLVWLGRDTRPPVWDMAMHQSYAMNYLPGVPADTVGHSWELSGNYPPFVHVMIAAAYLVFHPGPHIAVLANVPATLLLLWGIYQLAVIVAGERAAKWACLFATLTPYLVWMSRETILDYWLSAWVTLGLVFLWKSGGFESRRQCIILGITCAFGLLTKWLFAAFMAAPALYIFIRHRVWKSPTRAVNCADTLILSVGIAGAWYIPNLPRLVRYFSDNAAIGALEGEPPVLSAQSFIYYLRLLEGYQLFGMLFLLLLISCFFVWKKRLFKESPYWLLSVAGGWLAMTLLRTKDPRFTMPLLGLLMIVPGAWVSSWRHSRIAQAARWGIVGFLCLQAYAINFGIGAIPRSVTLLRGYEGSLRWDWNLYLQDYFNILGAPRRENWQQFEILSRVVTDGVSTGLRPSLAIVPDLARFNAANFHLYARLRRQPVRVQHIQSRRAGLNSFDGFDYVVMTERDQGMTWSTATSLALNQTIMDQHQTFLLVETYLLPNGDAARLYRIRRGEKEGG